MFAPVVSSLLGLILDAFIHLMASRDTCHNQLCLESEQRKLGSAKNIFMICNVKHESWSFLFQSENHGTLFVSNVPTHMDSSLHRGIKSCVFYLGEIICIQAFKRVMTTPISQQSVLMLA